VKHLSTAAGISLGCLFLLLLATVTAFFMFSTVSFSSTSTLKSGRTVTVQSDGWGGASLEDSVDTTTIEMSGYKIVVAPKELIVDGRQLAAIDPSVKSVAIRLQNREITFNADGATVASLRR
jgi:hypothetical protein